MQFLSFQDTNIEKYQTMGIRTTVTLEIGRVPKVKSDYYL